MVESWQITDVRLRCEINYFPIYGAMSDVILINYTLNYFSYYQITMPNAIYSSFDSFRNVP